MREECLSLPLDSAEYHLYRHYEEWLTYTHVKVWLKCDKREKYMREIAIT